MNYYLVLFGVFDVILESYFINCDIGSDILNYYNSEPVLSFKSKWETNRKAYENALQIALKESFGKKGMNIIERKYENVNKLSNGFYVYDNVVHVIFQEMRINELPHLIDPEVTFPLPHNALLVKAEIGKMIIVTKYSLMRNSSEVMFTGTSQDPYKTSPFVLQQVQAEGNLAIIADGCAINGYSIATLSGETIALGHDTFKVDNCKFSVEISAERLGSPPVISPYFSREQRRSLENLISKPIRKELMIKLQAGMFSYVNASLLDSDLPKYRYEQEKIFKETWNHINKFIRDTNKQTIMENQASQDLGPLEIIWIEKQGGNSYIMIKDVVVDGLDSAYSPHTGGPYKLERVGIAETLRYNTLKVRGKIFFKSNNIEYEHAFSIDLQDVTVNLDMDWEDRYQLDTDSYIHWRNTDFSITNIEKVSDRIIAESLINGYLINEIPKCIVSRRLILSNADDQKQIKSEENLNEKTQYAMEDLNHEEMINDETENTRDLLNTFEDDSTKHEEEIIDFRLLSDENVHISIDFKEGSKDKYGPNNEMLMQDQDVNKISDSNQSKKVKSNIFPSSSISNEEISRKQLKELPTFVNDKGFLSQTADKAKSNVSTLFSRRKHKNKNTKYVMKRKHHQNKRHKRRKQKKVYKRNKKSLNKRKRKQKYEEMPIYVSDDEM